MAYISHKTKVLSINSSKCSDNNAGIFNKEEILEILEILWLIDL